MCLKVGYVLLYLGMLHEGHKRADRSLGGSVPGIPNPAGSMRAETSRPIARGLGAWNLKMVRPMRATSEPTVRSGARHQGITTGYQPVYRNISSNLVNFKSRSKPTT